MHGRAPQASEARRHAQQGLSLASLLGRLRSLIMTPLQASGSRSSNEARFRDIADHAPVMMWVTDPSGYCIYLNRRWYEFTGQSKAGEFLGYVGSVIDIHERIQAEERLRESEDHFRHTVELNPQVPWTADPD